MRALARELNSPPMALYRHVRDGDGLLVLLLDGERSIPARRRMAHRRQRGQWRLHVAPTAPFVQGSATDDRPVEVAPAERRLDALT